MIRLISQNKHFFRLFFGYVILAGLLQVFCSKTELFLWINTHYSAGADTFFKAYTYFGHGFFFALLAIILAVFYPTRLLLITAMSFATTGIASRLLKQVIFADNLRPKAFFEGKMSIRFAEGIEATHAHHSFPSGHTITAFALFTSLALMIPNKKWGILFFFAALLVAYSRVYLSQHFVEDVYAGSLIGCLLTVACFYWISSSPLSTKDWMDKPLTSLFKKS